MAKKMFSGLFIIGAVGLVVCFFIGMYLNANGGHLNFDAQNPLMTTCVIALAISAILAYPGWRFHNQRQFRNQFKHDPRGDEEQRRIIQEDVNLQIALAFKAYQKEVKSRETFMRQFTPKGTLTHEESLGHLQTLADHRQREKNTLANAEFLMRTAKREKYLVHTESDYYKMAPEAA